MKTPHTYIDLGTIFDELFNAANQFRSKIEKNISCGSFGGRGFSFDENIDYYPGFSYPPMNIFLTEDKSLNFEFALAGFDEKNIELSFSGDYMIFSARIENTGTAKTAYNDAETPNIHYLKRRLKLKDIEKQKYYVPLDKYDQEKAQAVYKSGILKITVPPRPEKTKSEGFSITIITEER